MRQHFYIGVDGGATKSIVRIEDDKGKLLGRITGGPANISLSVDKAWQSINDALSSLLQSLSLSLQDGNSYHVGMGLAGCEVVTAYQSFINHTHSFTTLVVTSDSHIACLGAHNGKDGAIIIAGTGVVGFQIQKGQTAHVSGWGFPHDDEGGGAWLGLNAIGITLRFLDKRQPVSGLAKAIYSHFNEDMNELVSWANQANSTQFATLAPLVLKQAELQDESAISLLKQAALALDEVGLALFHHQIENSKASAVPAEILPCALVGSIAPFLKPYLSSALKNRLVSCEKSPEEGAIILLKDYLNESEVAHG